MRTGLGYSRIVPSHRQVAEEVFAALNALYVPARRACRVFPRQGPLKRVSEIEYHPGTDTVKEQQALSVVASASAGLLRLRTL